MSIAALLPFGFLFFLISVFSRTAFFLTQSCHLCGAVLSQIPRIFMAVHFLHPLPCPLAVFLILLSRFPKIDEVFFTGIGFTHFGLPYHPVMLRISCSQCIQFSHHLRAGCINTGFLFIVIKIDNLSISSTFILLSGSRLFCCICMLFHPQSQLLLCDKFPPSHLQGWKIRTVQ